MKGPAGSTIKYPIIVAAAACAIALAAGYVFIHRFIAHLELDISITGTSQERLLIVLLTIVLAQSMLLIFAAPLSGILGANSGARKSLRERQTYKATEGIKYFRETFTDINPATVSLLMNLQIDHEKDVSATLLRMYHKKSIDMSSGTIVLLDPALCTEPCETELFKILQTETVISRQAMWQWGENRKNEAIQKGLLARKNSKGIKGCCIGCCALVVLVFAFFIVVPSLLSFGASRMLSGEVSDETMQNIFRRFEAIQGVGDSLDNTIGLLEQVFLEDGLLGAEDMQAINRQLQNLAVILGIMILVFAIPPYFIVKKLSHQTSSDGLQRTPEGHRRTEEVAALKRFIKDFGNFTSTEKEHVVVWDDFLVFAVVLGENTSVVQDIGRISERGISDMAFMSVADKQCEGASPPHNQRRD